MIPSVFRSAAAIAGLGVHSPLEYFFELVSTDCALKKTSPSIAGTVA